MTKKTLMKLLKSSKINVSGCVADLRKSLINHLKHCSINQVDVKEDVLRELVNSLNTKGINSEMKKLGIPIKGKNCVKRELLVNAFKNNTYTCSDIPIQSINLARQRRTFLVFRCLKVRRTPVKNLKSQNPAY